MPKRAIRTSPSGALLAVRQDEPTAPPMEAGLASIEDLAKCTQWFALNAETRPLYRSDPVAIGPSTAATASADRVAELADATSSLNLRALNPLAQQLQNAAGHIARGISLLLIFARILGAGLVPLGSRAKIPED